MAEQRVIFGLCHMVIWIYGCQGVISQPLATSLLCSPKAINKDIAQGQKGRLAGKIQFPSWGSDWLSSSLRGLHLFNIVWTYHGC